MRCRKNDSAQLTLELGEHQMIYCRWNEWNVQHIAEHGVQPEEVEYVLQNSRAPWPEQLGGGKLLVIGQTSSGEYLQVVFLQEEEGSIFVIHARPLREHEKRRYRRRLK